MIRTNRNITSNELLALTSILTARMDLSNRMGMQFEGDRNLYQALGYPSNIVYTEYLGKYKRHEMAKAVIDRPVKATWEGKVELEESSDDQDTQFELAWETLEEDLKLTSIFSRVDRLTGIGRYGILLLGLDDVKSPDQFINPVTVGNRKLMYVKAFGEGSAQINSYETNPKNKRYGLPVLYNLTTTDSTGGSVINITVHYSRIIHIVDDPLESEVESSPRLEILYNRLMDLEKIIGGSAEMYWKGARPGYSGELDKEYNLSKENEDALLDQLDEFDHNLRRVLINKGIKMNSLAQQVSDPKGHVEVQIQMVSVITGIPKRILTGSERGELSSGQDKDEWDTFVQRRRDDHADPRIIRPFVQRLIELKVLPEPTTKKYTIKWSNLFAASENDRVEIGKKRSEALKNYASTPMAESIMDAESFLEFGMGLDESQVELVRERLASGISEEETALRNTIRDLTTPPALTQPGLPNKLNQPGKSNQPAIPQNIKRNPKQLKK